MSELTRKLETLAAADHAANGGYTNQPYKLQHKGEFLTAYLRQRRERDGTVRRWFEIIRPAVAVDTLTLPPAPAPAPEPEPDGSGNPYYPRSKPSRD